MDAEMHHTNLSAIRQRVAAMAADAESKVQAAKDPWRISYFLRLSAMEEYLFC